MERIAEVLKNWVSIHLKELKTGRSPHLSYIMSKIITHPAPLSMIDNMSGYEILKLAYIVFFMFEGDDYETAKSKSEQLKLIVVTEIEGVKEKEEECNQCYGDGTLECPTCDGDTELSCYECDGDGEIDGEECDTCGGVGKLDCYECDGEGNLECYECAGDGDISTGDEEVEFDESYWTAYNSELISLLQEKLSNPKINKDFYSDVDGEGTYGDLMLLESIKETMDIEDFEYPIEEGSSMVTDIKDLDSSGLKDVINIKKRKDPKSNMIRVR